tara:strand:- start:1392 stop:2087 length:696 start_codon:yes stop_codon:yes gene_type:complete
MNNLNKPICIIPLRKNSVSIKNKNIIKFNKRPLAFYVIDVAIKSKLFDKIIVATDSEKYIQILKKIFKKNKILFFFRRSSKNARKFSPSEEVILEVLNNYTDSKDAFLIQATSPLLKKDDIIEGFKKYKYGKFDTLFSSYKSHKFFWKKNNLKNLISINYNYKKRLLRQQLQNFFIENGAFYIFKTKKFLKIKNRLFGNIGTYCMPEERSFEIDDYDQLLFTEKLKIKFGF